MLRKDILIELHNINNNYIKEIELFDMLNRDIDNFNVAYEIYSNYTIFKKDLLENLKKYNISRNKSEKVIKILEELNIISSRIMNRNKEYNVTCLGIKYIKFEEK